MKQPPPPQTEQKGGSDEVRQRVNRCMSKLSDRDTESSAAAELDAMALSLPPSSISTFLSAISDLRPTDKTPLRRHPLHLLSLLSAHHPPDSLFPYLPRMLAAALRRLRDPDSSVRSALVASVRSISAAVPSPHHPSLLLRPLSDALLHEQDANAQSAAAAALAATLSSSSPDLALHLQRLLPRLLKLLRSNAFKAKSALVYLLSAVVAAGGASTRPLLELLVPCLVEFLASEDWAARKAAAEALSQVAVSESGLLGSFKSSCISSFEPRRFDKVKIVRDSMNRMLEVWKDIPVDVEDDPKAFPTSQSQSNSSLKETTSESRFPNTSVGSNTLKSALPSNKKKSKFSESRSPPPNASPVVINRKKTTPSRDNSPIRPFLRKMDKTKHSDWRVEVGVPQSPRSTTNSEEKLLKYQDHERGPIKGNPVTKTEAKRMVLAKNYDDKGSKAASRVVPLNESGISQTTVGGGDETDEPHRNHKDSDLSLIRRQLIQIENQQSNLLELLQRFIGSSQNGIQSLETRVHGLEMALDDISRGLAVSRGRLTSNNDPGSNSCCRLPGAEFLASKLWRRTERRQFLGLSVSRYPALADAHSLGLGEGQESYKWGRLRPAGIRDGLVVNPLAEISLYHEGAQSSPQLKS